MLIFLGIGLHLSADLHPKSFKGYALIKMIYSGLCHTQLNEINGILGKDKFLPHCMGHEGVGKIINLDKEGGDDAHCHQAPELIVAAQGDGYAIGYKECIKRQ